MAITGDRLKIDGIGHFLGDRVLRVPTNQRSYAWEKDQVEDFWHDIIVSMEDETRDDYFIGSIVLSLTEDEDTLEVVDGQQRLATTTILLAAIRDYFLEQDNEDRAKLLEEKLFYTHDETLKQEPRLSMNTDDNAFFFKHIVQRPPKGQKRENLLEQLLKDKKKRPKESHKHIANSQQILRSFVFGHVTQCRPEDADRRLMKIMKYVRDKVKMICVIVESHDDAYTVFETLNDRGLDLSKADLLKNHLFRTAGNRRKDIESQWNEMIGALQAVTRKEIAVDYIRYLWISENGHVRTKELYKQIKKSVRDQAKTIEFSGTLAEAAATYASILNSDHPNWSEHGESIKNDISNLIMLGVERLHPITLAAVRSLEKKELRNVIYYLVCASVRILVASPSPGGVFEQNVADVAPLVTKGTIKKAKELAQKMNEKIVPSDAVFEAQFAVANVSQTGLARYYFRAMENAHTGDEPLPARVTKEQAKGNIEHVMPENPSAAWSHVTEDVHRALYKRIGNLALMAPKENANVGNGDFRTVKVPAYKKCVLGLTKEIAKAKKWDEEEIEKRQKRLAALAVKTWPNTIK